jgi:alkaline phosphatase D
MKVLSLQLKQLLWVAMASFGIQNVSSQTTSFAFSSCNNPESGSMSIMPTLLRAVDTLDGFIWLGDNIYLEDGQWNSYDKIMARYNEVFRHSYFKELQNKTAQYAIWDDHDAGPNDCDGSFKNISSSMKAFKEFWRPNYEMPNLNSYYGSKLVSPDVELFFLDNRTFRRHHSKKNKTVLGSEQLAWFKQAYSESDAAFKLVLLGGQLLNTAQVFENMSLFPEERNEIIDILQSNAGIPVVLTGDRHSGEINRLEGNRVIIEVTASPLTASSHPHHDELNELRIHTGTTETQHFGIVKCETDENGFGVINVWLVDSYGAILFKHRETMSIQNLND